ncbi:RagB/SusD family nutrient uptake outer membrane protein [Mariniflexile sp. AS56]|uniref:RagB/SusD family nutrient uptake outer membrane protein n=1 Tax=Mariniflexile sp. AS56 TaxID=3063957 RepID=UPI0026EA42BB|nr:RagB/SusD family nutrient uptake outer membrane protein [Mariniflexile sp. AS56]MDO7173098.1 RagB/SusD family nutrient uptake outer membrane protein [Mariniflexile sp. AS56]
MKNIKLVYVILLVLLGFSCETYLEEPNPNAPELLESVNNLDDTNRVLNGVYNSLFNHYVLSIEEDNFRTDIGAAKNRLTPSIGQAEHLDYYYQTVTPSTRRIEQRWGALYRGIFTANQALAALDKIEPTLSTANQVKAWNEQRAQALFFRGLYHFYAHSVFNKGAVIIRDKYESNLEFRHKDVSTSAEVIAFFRKDLEDALPYLPMPSEVTELGRVTKGAAKMILANSYLYEATEGGQKNMALIDKAITLYEELRDSYGYTLETQIDNKTLGVSKMFTTLGDFNKESIFEIPYTNTFGEELDVFNEASPSNRLAWRASHFKFGGQSFMQPAAWLIMAYENDPLDTSKSVNTITTGDGNLNTRRESLRSSNMLFLNNDLDTPIYSFPNVLNSLPAAAGSWPGLRNNTGDFVAFKKYTNHDLGLASEIATPGGVQQSGKNVVINRLSEVLLNLAECYIYKGKLQESINEINKIRDRWALMPLDLSSQMDNPGVAYDETTLMKRLMYFEKPLELSLEGHAIRVIDLRRWNIAPQRFTDLSTIYYKGVDFPRTGRRPITQALARGTNTNVSGGFISDIITVDASTVPADASTQQAQKIFQEFVGVSGNYNKNAGYLPIPNEEDINNNGYEN